MMTPCLHIVTSDEIAAVVEDEGRNQLDGRQISEELWPRERQGNSCRILGAEVSGDVIGSSGYAAGCMSTLSLSSFTMKA